MTECVLCDWTMDWQAPPLAAYLIGGVFPLRWYPDGPGPVWASEAVTPESTARVAVVAHWAKAHPDQLEMALGEPFEIRPMGNAPPVDTVLGVDLAKDGETTIVKAHKVWIAPIPPPGEPVDGTVWIELGGVTTPLEFRYSQGYDE